MKINVAGRDVNVYERSISELRAWFADISNQAKDPDVMGLTFFEGVSLREISLFTDLSASQIENLRPSEVAPLVKEIIKENPLWNEYKERMISVHKQQIAQQAQQGR